MYLEPDALRAVCVRRRSVRHNLYDGSRVCSAERLPIGRMRCARCRQYRTQAYRIQAYWTQARRTQRAGRVRTPVCPTLLAGRFKPRRAG
jgi:hypothetical protein